MRSSRWSLALVVLSLALAGCIDPETNTTQDMDGGDGGDPTPTATNATETPSDDPDPSASPSDTPTDEPTGSPTPPAGETHTVEIGKTVKGALADYDPDPIRIAVGDSVVWVNRDSATHTATETGGDGFDTGTLAGDAESEAIRFDTAGTYTYYCKAHPSTMKDAQVIVE